METENPSWAMGVTKLPVELVHCRNIILLHWQGSQTSTRNLIFKINNIGVNKSRNKYFPAVKQQVEK